MLTELADFMYFPLEGIHNMQEKSCSCLKIETIITGHEWKQAQFHKQPWTLLCYQPHCEKSKGFKYRFWTPDSPHLSHSAWHAADILLRDLFIERVAIKQW